MATPETDKPPKREPAQETSSPEATDEGANEGANEGAAVAAKGPRHSDKGPRRLVVMDMDSTLIKQEVIDMLAEEAGHGQEVAELTVRAMEGELDFETTLRERVALLSGLGEEALENTYRKLHLQEGAREFMKGLKEMGFTTGLISGGFTYFIDRIGQDLGIDHTCGNQLELKDGKITGQVLNPVIDQQGKAGFLKETAARENIDLQNTIAIGDGANDIEMLKLAGFGIAFCAASKTVREIADVHVDVPDFMEAYRVICEYCGNHSD